MTLVFSTVCVFEVVPCSMSPPSLVIQKHFSSSLALRNLINNQERRGKELKDNGKPGHVGKCLMIGYLLWLCV
jgi:hypothetical protein